MTDDRRAESEKARKPLMMVASPIGMALKNIDITE